MASQILPRHVCQEMRGQVSYLEEQFTEYEKEAREVLRIGWADAQERGERFPARFLNHREWMFVCKIAGFDNILDAAAWLRGERL